MDTLPYDSGNTPIIIAGFVISFLLAFGVGANDVANSFGTSVGSGVLTLKKACVLATIFEILGAILMGYKVSDTIRKGILDVSLYNNSETELMLGSLSALGGSSLWNLIATFLGLPISGTHTIVGATVGFTLCARGLDGVRWNTFAKIVASWFVSPLLSGAMSSAIFLSVHHFILKKKDPITPGLKSLPIFYGLTFLVNVFSIVHDGPQLLRFDQVPWWGALIASGCAGLLTGIFVWIFVVPHQKKKVHKIASKASQVKFMLNSAETSRSGSPSGENTPSLKDSQIVYEFNENSSKNSNGYLPADSKDDSAYIDRNLILQNNLDNKESDLLAVTCEAGLNPNVSQLPLVEKSLESELSSNEGDFEDRADVNQLFSFLQVLTATFGSFAHGGNDVSNAIGPLIAMWAIYSEGSVAQKSEPSIFILLFGGLGIAVGLWVWGRRVIKTIGEDLTKVTPSSGFTIEIGAAFTVLLASKVGLPISTTHCKVGSVVFVGWSKSSRKGVDWRLFRNIAIAWAVTVPLTAAMSAFLMYLLSVAFLR